MIFYSLGVKNVLRTCLIIEVNAEVAYLGGIFHLS